MKSKELRLVEKPKFKKPKVRFNGKYYNKKMREIRRRVFS